MKTWQSFLNSLDTDGGKIMLLVIALTLGMAGLYFKIDKAEDLFVGAGSALLAVLKMTGTQPVNIQLQQDKQEPPVIRFT